MPCNCNGNPDILQSQRELINDTLVVHSSLIVHAPCSSSEFQTTLVDQFLDKTLHLLGLLLVPLGEERGLHLNEATTGILQQFTNNRVQNVLYTSMLNIILGTIIILIHGL